jgi:SAM-dependent methyltransferase
MLSSLHRRPRGRAIAPLLSGLSGGLVAPPPAPPPEAPAPPAHVPAAEPDVHLAEALTRFAPPPREDRVGPPTRALLARIDEADVAEVRARVEPELQAAWNAADPVTREQMTLVLGVHYGVAGILEKTGLRRDAPPEDVHAMGRGPLAAGGDFWISDVLMDAAQECGLVLDRGSRVLDFGCSSGRHLRVLAAWRPDVVWMGCDPNREAIEWADEHLPGIDFFVSPQEPPLDLETGSLDAVLGVSVWSHFSAGAAERWLGEMHRLLRTGGLLVLTTQGFGSIGHYQRIGTMPPELAAAAVEDLLSTGHHFVQAFGEDGDWGVKSDEWGLAYMTLEWLAERMTPHWSVSMYRAARIDTNQDLVVLRREGTGG